MTQTWESVRLEQVLKRVERFETREDTVDYKFAGTYSYARGIFSSGIKRGATFKLDKIQRIHSGDFVYCKIMAWEGAFGLVPESLHEYVMSGAFVAYNIDRSRLEPLFLDWYFKIPSIWQGIGSQSSGTNVRRQSLHPSQFEASIIPLPPLEEQKRIVARVENLAAQIAEARGLRESVVTQAEQMCRSYLAPETNIDFIMTPMKELVLQRSPDVYVQATEQYHFAGVYCFGRGMFKSVTKYGSEFSYPKLSRVKAGDFTYPKLMAWEGALSVVPPECDGLVVSTEYPVFEINTTRVLPEVLDVYFKTPSVWEAIAGTSTGTNVRRRRLIQAIFSSIYFHCLQWKPKRKFDTLEQ